MRTKTLAELLALPTREADYLIGPEVLPADGGTMAIYGKAGTLKSFLTLDMAFCLARGDRWLGMPTKRSPVLIIQGEQLESQYAQRVVKYAASLNGAKPTNLFFDNDVELKLDNFYGLQVLLQDMEERKPKVVILDCLYQLVSGSVSSEVDLKRFVSNVDKVRQRYGTAIVLVHHPRKEGEEDRGVEEMLSSSILGNWLDTTVKVTGVPYGAIQPSVVRLDFQKVKNATVEMPPIQVRFNRRTARFSLA